MLPSTLSKLLRAQIATDADLLPPVPADPRGEGRHVSWAVLAQAPHFFYGAEKIAVDQAWVDGRVEAYGAYREAKGGYIPPVLVAHEDTGERIGDMFAVTSAMLRRRDKDGEPIGEPVPSLLAALAWVAADAPEKIEKHILTHVSVGLYSIHRPDTGEVLEDVPAEASVTSVPHLGEARILNKGIAMDPEEIAALQAEVEAMRARIAELEAALEEATSTTAADDVVPPEEDAPVEASEEPVEMTALRERVRELEAKAAEAEMDAHSARIASAYEGGAIRMTADVVARVAELTMGDEALLTALDAAYEAPETQAEAAPAGARIPEVLRRRLSSAAVPPATGVPATREECYALAEAQSGGDPVKLAEAYKKNLKAMEVAR